LNKSAALLFLGVVFLSPPILAVGGTEDDLVVPAEMGSIDPTLDPVTTPEQVKSADAQKRITPKEDTSHTSLVPYYGADHNPELQSKMKNGTYIYKTQESPQHFGAGFHAGPYTPTNLQGDTPGVTYTNVYGGKSSILVGLDAEWQFFQGFGKLGLKGGLGFFSQKGQGRFLHNPGQQADEVFTLFELPMSAGLIYHFQYWNRQILVPFAEGGGDYFGLLEARSDKTAISEVLHYGGAAAAHWAAGLQVQLDFLDRQGIWELDQEYGINHIYLVLDARQIIGLSSLYDVSSFVFEGGILFEF